ncbi:unnamed protein product [Calypogeia fissa]
MNYIPWAFKVERQFRKDKVWLELVCPDPANPITVTAEQLVKKKEKVLYIFSVTVRDHIIPIVKKYIDKPNELWINLQSRFESAAVGKSLILKDKLTALCMVEGSRVEQYTREIDSIVMQLADIGTEVDDRELIRITLNGLPSSWKQFSMSIVTLLHQFPKMTFADLISHM